MTDVKKSVKPSKADIAYSIVKAGLGSIPIAGAAASELMTLLVTPPLERRRSEWMEELGERLRKLEQEKSLDLASLRENDLFIDTVLYATQLALRTSEQEKIEYLRNAIVNTALGDTPDQSLTKMFLNLIDEFTVWHIRILTLFDDPQIWYIESGKEPPKLLIGTLSSVLIEAYPELKGKTDFCNLIWDDLHRAGLHQSSSLQTMISGNGVLESRTTDFGKKFLDFISNTNYSK
jgi:hypothetical protein